MFEFYVWDGDRIAETFGLRTVIGRGLPGKYTPASAADIIAETIYKEMNL